jgi:hypothetical protein
MLTGIIAAYHGRGGDDPVHRTLKDFGTMSVSFYMV